MEPRPLNKPQRQPTPQPAPAPPPVDRSNWNPTPARPNTGASSSYSAPIIPPAPSYAGPATDPAAARSAWFDPAAATPVMDPTLKPGYSPGPALTPIDGGRGARILGPLLALIVLAAVVSAVVFVALHIFNGDDGKGNTLAAANITATSVAAQSSGSAVAAKAGTTVATQPPGGSAVAGAEETAAPGATQAAGGKSTTAAAAPTQAPTTAKPTATAAAPSKAAVSARSMLPSSSDLPAGFERTEDDKRTEDAVAQSFPDAAEAASNLTAWDWRENAYRTFEIPASANPDPNEMTYVNISIHRFGSKKGASSALTYFSNSVMSTQGLTEVSVEKIGDRVVALSGNPDGTANLVVLYIRTGDYLIRIGGSSPSGDPTQAVIDLAKKVVGE